MDKHHLNDLNKKLVLYCKKYCFSKCTDLTNINVCVQYDFVELLDGSRLIAKEKRGLVEVEGAARKARSVNVHEAEFIHFLDSGTWHLAFYNDGKNTEQVSYNTIIIGNVHM